MRSTMIRDRVRFTIPALAPCLWRVRANLRIPAVASALNPGVNWLGGGT